MESLFPIRGKLTEDVNKAAMDALKFRELVFLISKEKGLFPAYTKVRIVILRILGFGMPERQSGQKKRALRKSVIYLCRSSDEASCWC